MALGVCRRHFRWLFSIQQGSSASCLSEACRRNPIKPLSTYSIKPSWKSPGGRCWSFLPCTRFHVGARRWCHSLPWSEILPYKSIRVNLTEAVMKGWALKGIEDFPAMLQSDMAYWKSEGRSAIWLHIPVSLGALIPLAAEQGFVLHHGKGGEVVMNRWLLETKSNKLPLYPSHQVGACGVVSREDTGEVLVIQDRFKAPVWKFPGGLADHAEDIAETAVREVKEETGVDSEFQSILAFRQIHHLSTFDYSDLYFVCRLKALTFDLQPCKDEVVKCQWMTVEDLAVCEDATHFSHRIARLLLHGRGRGFENIDITMEEVPSIYRNSTFTLFLRTFE